MQQVHLDLFAGVAGDMLVGALLDAGASEEVLHAALAGLPSELSWRLEKTERHAIAATRFVVTSSEKSVHRHLSDCLSLVEEQDMSDRAKAWAKAAFTSLAEAEARCHGTTPEQVHFHEVGAVDALADLCGACALMDSLKPDQIWASAIAVGSGQVKCVHGVLPVPAPGTLALLEGMPICGQELKGERATPTGVALLRAWQVQFGSRPPAVLEGAGYGAGTLDTPEIPNLVRVSLECAEGPPEGLVELRTLVDDVTGEHMGAFLEAAHAMGAVDCFAHAAYAKKGRPAFEVVLLCKPADRPLFEDLLFRHLGTLGMRVATVQRTRRPRTVRSVETPLGALDMKVRTDAGGETYKPEFEALKQKAHQLGLTPREAAQLLAEEKDS